MSEFVYPQDIASRLGWKIQTFRNRKRSLVEEFDFPAAAALPGRERWLAADIDAWLASRGQASSAAETPSSRAGEGQADPAGKPAQPAARGTQRRTPETHEPAKRKPGRPRNAVLAGGRE